MGYAACFDGALALVKKSADKSFDSRTEVTIELNKEGDSNFFSLVLFMLLPVMAISPKMNCYHWLKKRILFAPTQKQFRAILT